MKVVPPLEKWKKHKQSEREEFSDEKTSEDRSDVEDDTPLEIPKKKKRAKSPPKRKKRKLMKIPKINPRGIKRAPPPPPHHVRNLRTDPEFYLPMFRTSPLKVFLNKNNDGLEKSQI